MGRAGKKNDALMVLAQTKFDVFLTVDRNLSFQQNLPIYDIDVIVLQAHSNRLIDLEPFVEKINEHLERVQVGTASIISIPDSK